ncbi:hypothetical protein J2S43_003260 [Catenuloplanes nepalensis]|uniref:Sel1 repeat family protein n=1 Tax=Catenuloplanes nepalensis TaxID=587533 RepID=A0ABT9MU11_9ACTN|nr:hypothetical protein [Catenuloplanes nepalensis]
MALFRQAAELGLSAGAAAVAKGMTAEGRHAEAREWNRQAAELGNAPGMHALAQQPDDRLWAVDLASDAIPHAPGGGPEAASRRRCGYVRRCRTTRSFRPPGRRDAPAMPTTSSGESDPVTGSLWRWRSSTGTGRS